MMPTKPIPVPPVMADEALPNANWADAYEVCTQRRFGSMRELATATVGTTPSWAKWLLKMRNLIVVPFGLKPDGKDDAPNPTTRIGIFPILQEKEDRIVLGLDDTHLNFRVIIERYIEGDDHRIRATTLVQWHNAFGRAYIGIIVPFHKLIVATALKQAIWVHFDTN